MSRSAAPAVLTADALWRALRAADVTDVAGLPDTQTDRLFAGDFGATPRIVRVAREGEAFGVAAGLWAGGRRPVVLIQSTGLFEAGDALRSFHQELEAPLDVLVGWRGRSGKLNAGYADTAAELLLATLDAWRLPWVEFAGEDAAERLTAALVAGRDRERGGRAYLLPQ